MKPNIHIPNKSWIPFHEASRVLMKLDSWMRHQRQLSVTEDFSMNDLAGCKFLQARSQTGDGLFHATGPYYGEILAEQTDSHGHTVYSWRELQYGLTKLVQVDGASGDKDDNPAIPVNLVANSNYVGRKVYLVPVNQSDVDNRCFVFIPAHDESTSYDASRIYDQGVRTIVDPQCVDPEGDDAPTVLNCAFSGGTGSWTQLDGYSMDIIGLPDGTPGYYNGDDVLNGYYIRLDFLGAFRGGITLGTELDMYLLSHQRLFREWDGYYFSYDIEHKYWFSDDQGAGPFPSWNNGPVDNCRSTYTTSPYKQIWTLRDTHAEPGSNTVTLTITG